MCFKKLFNKLKEKLNQNEPCDVSQKSIKETFDDFIKWRSYDEYGCEIPYYDVEEAIVRDYDETIAFLRQATHAEIGCAVEVLDYLIDHFPRQEIIDIFKARVDEFVEEDKIIDWYPGKACLCDYGEEVQLAQEQLDKINIEKDKKH